MNMLRSTIITSGILAMTTAAVPHAQATANPETNEISQISEQKSEGAMDQQVKQFFTQFEKANASSDVSAIGSLYAETFTFAGPGGVQMVKNADFIKVIPKMKMHLKALGLSETRLESVEVKSLGSRYLLATVVWRMKIRNSSESKHVDASATYMLMRNEGDALSIVLQIDHQDLASVVQSQLTK